MHDGIVGGKVSIPHSWPYMVYIRDKFTKQACGGFLVRGLFDDICPQHAKVGEIIIF